MNAGKNLVKQGPLGFSLHPDMDFEQIVAGLSAQHNIAEDGAAQETWHYYDTFDWRLYRHGDLLSWDGDRLFLTSLGKNDIRLPLPLDSPPRFIWDLPDCPLKEAMAKNVEMRAFLELVQVCRERKRFKVLNKDDKTVLRFELVEEKVSHEHSWIPVFAALTLLPVRGYTRVRAAVQKKLSESGLEPLGEDQSCKMLQAAGLTPLDYSSKVSLKLSPEQHAEEAAKVIYRRLLEVMRRNIDGTVNDIDTEFLHDFRVAVRRTRSGLSQIKGVFEPVALQQAKANFAKLGKWTNLMRDLDVYLLQEARYRAMLPEADQSGIDRFFEYLRELRKDEQRALTEKLRSQELTEILAWWDDFLNRPVSGQPEAVSARTPIIELAKKSIWRKYRRVYRDGRRIGKDSPDESLHDLRIECKKLRYLLEFFSSLFPRPKMTMLVASLKKLQNKLGDFNDLTVQQETLKRIAGKMSLHGRQVRRTVLSIGILVGILCEQHRQLKVTCKDEVIRFLSDTKTSQWFHKLFASTARGDRS